MGRFLNVGIIQMPLSKDTAENFRYLEEKTDALMTSYHKPELVVGVECLQRFTPEPIPGPSTEFFASIARRHGIYFIPGSVNELHPDLPEGYAYNAAPVFNPKGEIIAVYRKMAPWEPSENMSVPGREYVAFDIPEKQTRVGVQICYDSNFPEISRNETLMGAEVLVKLTLDPQELNLLNRPIHFARALENQAYFVSTNACGFNGGSHLYGGSMVISPEGQVLWEAGQEETLATVTLDLDLVSRCRNYGTFFMDHYLQHVKKFNFPMPFADRAGDAPVFHNIQDAPKDFAEYDVQSAQAGAGTIGVRSDRPEPEWETYNSHLKEFLEKRSH